MTPTRFLALAVLILASTLIGCGSSDGDGGGTTNISAPGTPSATPTPAASFTYCKTKLDAMRTAEAPGAPVLTMACANYQTFAQNATLNLITTGVAHAYFMANGPIGQCPGATAAAENQGISQHATDIAAIDAIFALFLAEKALPPGNPGRGHYETIINPALRSVAIGLHRSTDGRFYLTNDFNDIP